MSELKTVRQSVVSDERVNALITDLSEFPQRIQDARENLTKAEFDLAVFNEDDLCKEKVDALELEAAYEAAQETDGNGKKKNTNDQQRKAASAKLLSKLTEYPEVVNALANAKRVKAGLIMHIGKLRNQLFYAIDEFKGQMAISGLVAGLCHEYETLRLTEYLENKKTKLATIISDLKEEISNA